MSAGRKVAVVFTQAEADILRRASRFLFDGIMAPTSREDMKALERASDKLTHQLAAVRGKVGAA